MMKAKKAGFWVSLALGAALCTTAQAATIDGVEVSDLFCLTCHGTDGQGNQGIDAPRLAGMERWYLNGSWNCSGMACVAHTLKISPARKCSPWLKS